MKKWVTKSDTQSQNANRNQPEPETVTVNLIRNERNNTKSTGSMVISGLGPDVEFLSTFILNTNVANIALPLLSSKFGAQLTIIY